MTDGGGDVVGDLRGQMYRDFPDGDCSDAGGDAERRSDGDDGDRDSAVAGAAAAAPSAFASTPYDGLDDCEAENWWRRHGMDEADRVDGDDFPRRCDEDGGDIDGNCIGVIAARPWTWTSDQGDATRRYERRSTPTLLCGLAKRSWHTWSLADPSIAGGVITNTSPVHQPSCTTREACSLAWDRTKPRAQPSGTTWEEASQWCDNSRGAEPPLSGCLWDLWTRSWQGASRKEACSLCQGGEDPRRHLFERLQQQHGGRELPVRRPDSLQLQEEGPALGADSHRRRDANWPARPNGLGRRGTPRAIPRLLATARAATSTENDFGIDIYDLMAIAIILAIAATACVGTAATRPRATADHADSRGADEGGRRCRRRPALKVRRARISQRKVKMMPGRRIRACCRRMEAFAFAYLLLSNHALVGTRPPRPVKGGGHGPHGDEKTTQTREGRWPYAGGADGHRLKEGGHIHWTADVEDKLRRCWTEAARVGEAAHPGPTAATVAVGGTLRRILGHARAAISYPRPGTGSLRGAVAPGFTGGGRQKAWSDEEDLFALRVEAVNATGWRALQRRLLSTSAHALMAQETWLSQDAIPAASAWAKRKGWHSVWAPALEGPNGGASGGVAIFARDSIGLRYPEGGSHIICLGRAVAAVLEPPAHRPFLLVSTYLCHGVGPNAENLDLLARVGARVQALRAKYDCVMGGDINMEPPDFAATGFETEVDAVIMAPRTARGTYRSAKAASLLDFFVVSNRLAAAVDRVATVEASGVKGHTPVLLTFKPRVTTLRALHLRKPPEMGRERVYGPTPPPPDWAKARRAAEAALASARSGDIALQERLDTAYREWADLAEIEVANFTGSDPKKWGERGRLPNLVWRSVVRETPPKIEHPHAAAAAWLNMTIRELGRIAKIASNGRSNDDQPAQAIDDDPDDLPQDDAEMEIVEQEIARARGRKPPATRRSCIAIIDETISSLIADMPHCGEGARTEAIRDARQRTMEGARWLRSALAEVDDASHDSAAMGQAEAAAARPDPFADITTSLEQLGAEVATLEADYTTAAKTEDQRRWKDWVSEGIDAGAARAHAYTRLPKAWTPTTEHVADGTVSSAVDDLMEGQREKYRKLWRPADCPFHYQWQDEEELPIMEVEHLRTTAGTFTKRTSTTYDGFHPRMLGQLSDDALATLAIIFAAVERAGVWPRQVSLIVAALIPKQAGGFRPIGMAPAIYRLWSKARRVYGDEWEQRNQRSYFSAARGNGPVDTLWRLAARQEAGVAGGELAATISEDLQAFFEAIDRERLVAEAKAVGFPAPIVRAALAQYAAARMLSMGGRICREMYPTTGVVAGCSLAMVLTKIYSIRALDEFVSKAPPTVALDTHVDDFTVSAIGQEAAVLEDLMAAHEKLREVVEDTLLCNFAKGKTAITATSRSLAAAISRRLGVSGGVAKAATLLGIDNTAAAPRASLRGGSKKSKRLKAALARRKRLQQVQRAVGSKAKKVFVAGIRPAATHGAQIWGLDDAEIGKLRRLAAVALRPQARGRSLGITLLWHDLPTAAAEVAPLLQLARMIWGAVVKRQDAMARGSSLADLRRWWEDASVQFAPLVEELHNKRTQLGSADIPLAFTRRLWKQVRGPLGAAALTAARLGWRFDGPFKIYDSDGVETRLTNTSPRLLRRNAVEAVRANMERRVAHAWAEDEPQYHGRRACLDLVTSTVNNSKYLSGYQKGVMRAATCGAIMTGAKALRHGYKVTGLCPLCQRALDTMAHRVYGCPVTTPAVRAVVPEWFWDEAARVAQGSRFWTTGICPDPADLAPPPPIGLDVKVKIVDEAVRNEEEDLIAIGGRAYFDGSCTTPAVRRMARASCAVVQTDDDGRPVKVLQAAVPRHLPQSAQAAEHLGLGITIRALRRNTVVVGDCLNVVKAANDKCREVLGATKMYAGILLDVNAVPERRKLAGHIEWTRAHRTTTGEETADEARDIRGNAAADEEAREALEEHPPMGCLAESQLRYFEGRIKHVVDAVTTALALFPRASGKMPREDRPTSAEQAKRRRLHHWQFRGGAWRCTLCNDWRQGDRLPRARVRQRCRGRTLAEDAATMFKNGHQLYRVHADLPFVYCRKCGAWGHRRTRRLASICGPPAASGSQALNRIRRGLHPLQRRGPLGILLPREKIRTVARYCGVTGRWAPDDNDFSGDRGRDMRAEEEDAARPSYVAERPSGNGDEEATSARPAREGDEFANVKTTEPAVEERDHGNVEERSDEEDVFGHGGSLSESCVEARGLEARRSDEGGGAAAASGIVGGCSQPVAGAAWPAAAKVSSRRGVKSIREATAHGSTKEAVDRMAAGSRPSGIDATAKLREIRRRVMARCGRGGESAVTSLDEGAGAVTEEADRTNASEEQRTDDDGVDQPTRSVRRRVTEAMRSDGLMEDDGDDGSGNSRGVEASSPSSRVSPRSYDPMAVDFADRGGRSRRDSRGSGNGTISRPEPGQRNDDAQPGQQEAEAPSSAAAAQSRTAVLQPRPRHPRGGAIGDNEDSPRAYMENESRLVTQLHSSFDVRSSSGELSQTDSPYPNLSRAARVPPDAEPPRALRGHGSAVTAAPGAVPGGHEQDQRRRLHDEENRCNKRRRLNGKQPPSGSATATDTVLAIEESTNGVPRDRPGSSGCNSMQVGISARPSRSTTLSLEGRAPADRDGHVLGAHLAAATSTRVGGLAQLGAGLAERARGRGRPPEA